MGKLSVLILVLFMTALAIFAIYNKEVTTVGIPGGEVYEIPKFALIVLSMVIGALIALVFFIIRDTKRLIDNWQYQKRQRREMKVQELYSKALNSILAHHEDSARDALEGILAELPEHVDALLRLGDIYAAEEEFQKAISYYQKARMINPRNVETLFAIELIMEKTGRWADALKYLEDILELDEDNLSALYRKRDIMEKQSRWDELVYLQKAILKQVHTEKERRREQLNLVGYEYEYGRHSLETGQLEKAKKAFKTLIRLDKDFIPASLGLAEVMLGEGESEEAINLLEKTYEQTSSKIILARLEDLLISLGEPARLISIYEGSIMRSPNDQITRFFLGKLYYRLEMLDDAYDTLVGMDKWGIAYPDLHLLLGNIYMRRNDYGKAADEYRKVIDIKKAARLPYCCTQCGYTLDEWSGRCPDCRQWNTFQLNLEGTCSAISVSAGQTA